MKHAVIFLAVLAAAAPSVAIAQNATSEMERFSNNFLQSTPEQRYYWLNGAVTTLSHLISLRNREQGACAAKWYLDDRARAQKILEEKVKESPKEGPSMVLINLFEQACGKLTVLE